MAFKGVRAATKSCPGIAAGASGPEEASSIAGDSGRAVAHEVVEPSNTPNLAESSLCAWRQDSVFHQPFDAARPGVVGSHPKAGKIVGHHRTGLGVPDE